jgi:hypothetical protein
MLFLSCSQSTERSWTSMPGNTDTAEQKPASHLYYLDLYKFFTATDAGVILGRKAFITDSSFNNSDILSYKSAYTDSSAEHTKPPFGKVYFMFEEYGADSLAHRSYESIRAANQDHGIKDLHQMGDEAYYHTDGSKFHFILARKGKRMIRIKVNRITAVVSEENFFKTAEKIVDKL